MTIEKRWLVCFFSQFIENCRWVARRSNALATVALIVQLIFGATGRSLVSDVVAVSNTIVANSDDQTPASDNRKQPMTKVQLELLVKDLEKKVDDNATDSALRFELADQILRLAEFHFEQGDSQDAHTAWQRSFRLYDQLSDLISKINRKSGKSFRHVYIRPDETSEVVDPIKSIIRAVELAKKLEPTLENPFVKNLIVAQSLRVLGEFQLQANDSEDAERNLDKAVSLSESFLKSNPGSLDARCDAAKSYGKLAWLNLRQQNWERAETCFAQLIEHWEWITSHEPKNRRFRESLAEGLAEAGALYQMNGKTKQAIKFAKSEVSIRKQMSLQSPESMVLSSELAAAHNRLGTILIAENDLSGAREHLEAAIKLHQSTGVDSMEPSVCNEFAGELVNLAVMLTKKNQPNEALELLVQAEQYHLSAVTAEPDNGLFRFFFRNNLGLLLQTFLNLNRHEDAAKTIPNFLKYSNKPEDQYTAAISAAKCVNLANKDKILSKSDRDKSIEEYGRISVELLRKLVKKGLIRGNHLAILDFDSISIRDDFKELKDSLK